MTKISNLYSLTNYIDVNSNGNVVIAAPTSGFALDVTGTGRFTGQLTLGSTITNGTFTYTLPSATGTLALTSALGSYLPLSGGTLTGALNGTSATFSSTITSLATSGTATIIAEGSATNGEGLVSIRGKNSSGTSRRADFKYDNADVVRIATASPIGMQFETNDTTRMFIASGGNVGIGTTSPTLALSVIGQVRAGYATNAGVTIGLAPSGVPNNDLSAYILWGDNSTFGGENGDLIYIPRTSTTGAHRFYTGAFGLASEKMRITSGGNVGIGTTNAASRFNVRGTDSNSQIEFNNFSTGQNYILSYDRVASAYRDLIITTNGANNALVITPSGNVGIGTTAPNSGLHISSGATRGMRVDVDSGVQAISISPNGVFGIDEPGVGNGRFIINTNGRVGIGTASPSQKLDIRDGNLELSDSSFGNIPEIRFTGFSGGGRYIYAGIKADEDGQFNGHLEFWTTPSSPGFAAANAAFAERMRIDSSGNVGIGTSAPKLNGNSGVFLTVNGGSSGSGWLELSTSTTTNGLGGSITFNNNNIPGADKRNAQISGVRDGANNSGRIEFLTWNAGSASERMRITSGGGVEMNNSLAIGRATEGGVRLSIQGASTDSGSYAIIIRNGTPADVFVVRNDGLYITGNRPASPYNNTTGSGANMHVASDGVLYRSTSSIKYKKNVLDYSKGLAEVMQLRAVTYEGKSKSDEGKIFAGLIAEEVHDLGLTEFVQYAEDGTPDALAYQNMIALLTKAIQELSAKVTALENK